MGEGRRESKIAQKPSYDFERTLIQNVAACITNLKHPTTSYIKNNTNRFFCRVELQIIPFQGVSRIIPFQINLKKFSFKLLQGGWLTRWSKYPIGRSCQNAFINNYHMWIHSPITRREKALVLWTIFWCFSIFLVVSLPSYFVFSALIYLFFLFYLVINVADLTREIKN